MGSFWGLWVVFWELSNNKEGRVIYHIKNVQDHIILKDKLSISIDSRLQDGLKR